MDILKNYNEHDHSCKKGFLKDLRTFREKWECPLRRNDVLRKAIDQQIEWIRDDI